MLIISNNNESLDSDLIKKYEKSDGLTDQSLKEIGDKVNNSPASEVIDNDDIEDYADAIERQAKKNFTTQDAADFFNKKGLSDVAREITDIFERHNQLDSLKDIIENNGKIKFKSLLSSASRGVNILNYCKEFLNSAIDVSNIRHDISGNAVGRFERLLQLIIIGAAGKVKNIGDISADGKSIEVKGIDSHPSGRGTSTFDTVLLKLDALFGSDLISSVNQKRKPGSANYTTNQYASEFNKLVNEYSAKYDDGKYDLFKNKLIEIIREQYSGSKKSLNVPQQAYQIVNEYNFGSLTGNDIKSLFGRLQLTFYKEKEKFDYLFLVNDEGKLLVINSTNIVNVSKNISFTSTSAKSSSASMNIK